MAEDSGTAETPELEFVGMADTLAINADAFFVVGGGDSFTVFFFQHVVPDLKRQIHKTEEMQTKKTKCFARIVMSPLGFINFAKALASNINCDLVPKQTTEEATR
jgi:hypothetical protein